LLYFEKKVLLKVIVYGNMLHENVSELWFKRFKDDDSDENDSERPGQQNEFECASKNR